MAGSGQKLFITCTYQRQAKPYYLSPGQEVTNSGRPELWFMTLKVAFGHKATPLAILMLDTKESVEILSTRNLVKRLCKVQARIPAGICSKNIRNGKYDAVSHYTKVQYWGRGECISNWKELLRLECRRTYNLHVVLGQELTALLCKSTETGLVARFPSMHIIYLQKVFTAELGQLSSVPSERKLGYTW